nr:MAG TPA: hypothetical protein [Caudoviricetes sp.]
MLLNSSFFISRSNLHNHSFHTYLCSLITSCIFYAYFFYLIEGKSKHD